jgi:hypothetical protein
MNPFKWGPWEWIGAWVASLVIVTLTCSGLVIFGVVK